jgi:hypothetical protein
LRVFKLLERSCFFEQETVDRGEVEEFRCLRARPPSIAIDEDSIVDTQDNRNIEVNRSVEQVDQCLFAY